MGNGHLKKILHSKDPHCFWCGRVTILITEDLEGKPSPPLMATIDHLISRYDPQRWVEKKKGNNKKVLACYECNHKRSIKETLALSRNEVLRRSKGFSLSLFQEEKASNHKACKQTKWALDRINKPSKMFSIWKNKSKRKKY